MEAAILIDNCADCRLEDIDIDASTFDKDGTSVAGVADSGLAGVAVRDLPPGADCTIEDCVINDLFNGIFFVDTPSHVSGQRRRVQLTNTTVSECGPWAGASGSDRGHAGIRLLEAESHDIDLYITDCHLEHNHDALEPGNAQLLLRDTVFLDNENGLEYASGNDPVAYVTGCSFEGNSRFPTGDGGVSSPTGGLMVRFPSTYDITVRNSDFIDNQLGLSLRDSAGVTGEIDLGDGVGSLVTSFPLLAVIVRPVGGSTFQVSPTCPWPSVEEHRTPFCGLFTVMDTTVLALGEHLVVRRPLGSGGQPMSEQLSGVP